MPLDVSRQNEVEKAPSCIRGYRGSDVVWPHGFWLLLLCVCVRVLSTSGLRERGRGAQEDVIFVLLAPHDTLTSAPLVLGISAMESQQPSGSSFQSGAVRVRIPLCLQCTFLASDDGRGAALHGHVCASGLPCFCFFRVLPRMAAALMAKLLGLSGQQRKMHGRHTTAVSRRLTARVSEPVKTNRQSCTSPSPSQAHTTDGCSSSAHPFHNTPPRRNHRPTEGGEVRKSSARKRKQTGPLKAEPRR